MSPARAGSDFLVSFVLLPSPGSTGSSVSPAYGKYEEVGKKGEGGGKEGKSEHMGCLLGGEYLEGSQLSGTSNLPHLPSQYSGLYTQGSSAPILPRL